MGILLGSLYSLGVVLVLPWRCPARLAAQGGCLAAQGGRFVGSLGGCLGILWGALGCCLGAPAHLAAQGERFVLSGRAIGVVLEAPRSFGCTGFAFRAPRVCSGTLRPPAPRALAAQGARFVRFGGAPMGGQEAEEHHPL